MFQKHIYLYNQMKIRLKKDLTLFKKKLDFAEMAPSKPYVRITIKNQK